jgi:nucleotide-binding universal stress UspA family protein
VIAAGWRRCRAVLKQAHLPAAVPNRLVITQDDPATALLRSAGPGDLLVVGTHGHGRLAGLVAGSVSREILDRMTCDVMVVQPALAAAEPVLHGAQLVAP